jgi:hypothetical protein
MKNNKEITKTVEKNELPVAMPKWLDHELRERIKVSNKLEKIIFVGVINRTNTGALATAIGRAPTEIPVTRHIQPIKAIARKLVSEKSDIAPSTPLTFLKDRLEIGPGIQVVKETIGPNFENPAEWMETMLLLLEAGVDPKKMVFIPTFRDPMEVFLSWKRMWKWNLNNFPYDSFNFSFKKTLEMIGFAQSNGITVVPYIHEFLREEGSEKTLQKIVSKAGLPFDRSMVEWSDEDDAYWQGNIVKYDIPPDDWIQGSLSVKKGGRGGLIWRPVPQESELSEMDQKIVLSKIREASVVYNQVVSLAKKLLK